jgi:hypothetical protein
MNGGCHVEVEEKAVIRFFEIHEFAGISPEAQPSAEAFHFLKGRDPVRLAVEKQHRRQLAADQ